MILEATVFFILIGLAVFFFFIKTPYREIFMFLSCAIFLILGMLLFSNNGVSFEIQTIRTATEFNGTLITNTISDNSTQIYNLIGEGPEYNISSKYLAVFFIINAIVTGMISFVMFIKTDNPNQK